MTGTDANLSRVTPAALRAAFRATRAAIRLGSPLPACQACGRAGVTLDSFGADGGSIVLVSRRCLACDAKGVGRG